MAALCRTPALGRARVDPAFSYAADNNLIEFRKEGEFCVRLIQPTDAAGLEKEMLIELDPTSSKVHIVHKLTNRLPKTQEVAVWALTVLSEGTAYVPLEPFRSHDDALAALATTNSLAVYRPKRSTLNCRWMDYCLKRPWQGRAPKARSKQTSAAGPATTKKGSCSLKISLRRGSPITPTSERITSSMWLAKYMEIESLGPLVRLEQTNRRTTENVGELSRKRSRRECHEQAECNALTQEHNNLFH